MSAAFCAAMDFLVDGEGLKGSMDYVGLNFYGRFYVKASDLPFLDGERVGLIGRSMGGQVAMKLGLPPMMFFPVLILAGLAIGLVWFLLVRDTPRTHPLASAAEVEKIEAGIPVANQALERPLPWSAILSSRNVWAITASYFAYCYVTYIFFTWFFIYLSRVRGLDLKSSALYATLPFLAMAAASPLGGWIGDRLAPSLGEKRARCTTAAIAMGLCAAI